MRLKRGILSEKKIDQELHLYVKCPECGQGMSFSILDSSGICAFSCECGYSAYVAGGAIDIYQAAKTGGVIEKLPVLYEVRTDGGNGAAGWPDCGGRLNIDRMTTCIQVNPSGYSCMIYCLSDDCSWHVYTRAPLFIVLERLRENQLETLSLIEGVL
ncbi:MAG: hypothetical protein GY869_31630 [Planctomycetes bacterium]|nr:hypothetical protein [Planctomycetota bacterium]